MDKTEIKILLLENNVSILQSLVEKHRIILLEAQRDLDTLLEVLEETREEREREMFGEAAMLWLEHLAS